MDPDTTLAQIRELVIKQQTDELTESEAADLVELIDGLDKWMTKGSFMPTDWNALRV